MTDFDNNDSSCITPVIWPKLSITFPSVSHLANSHSLKLVLLFFIPNKAITGTGEHIVMSENKYLIFLKTAYCENGQSKVWFGVMR